jgi:hypothetical protein
MYPRLTLSEAVVAVLLLATLIWATVRVGPTAIDRWF